MSNETGVTTARSVSHRKGSSWRYVVMAAFIILCVGILSAGSYYEKEVRNLWNLQPWRRAAARQVVEEFIQDVQSDNVSGAIARVDPESYKPVKKNGRVIGLQHLTENGFDMYKIYFKELFAGQPVVNTVTITTVGLGSFVVHVTLSGNTESKFYLRRFGNEYKIVGLPRVPGRIHF